MKAGDALQPTATATTVRVRDGKTLTTDGPFAETRGAARRLLPGRGQGPRRGDQAGRAHPRRAGRQHRGAPGQAAAAGLPAARQAWQPADAGRAGARSGCACAGLLGRWASAADAERGRDRRARLPRRAAADPGDADPAAGRHRSRRGGAGGGVRGGAGAVAASRRRAARQPARLVDPHGAQQGDRSACGARALHEEKRAELAAEASASDRAPTADADADDVTVPSRTTGCASSSPAATRRWRSRRRWR